MRSIISCIVYIVFAAGVKLSKLSFTLILLETININ